MLAPLAAGCGPLPELLELEPDDIQLVYALAWIDTAMDQEARGRTTTIDHIGLRVSDYARSKKFFAKALAPLGYSLVMEFGGALAGFGARGKPDIEAVCHT